MLLFSVKHQQESAMGTPMSPPSHPTPHPTLLDCYRAPVWVLWVIQQISIVYMDCIFIFSVISFEVGFPGSSAGKESTWNTGNSGSILELGRSPGEGIGHSLQYSWASLMVQMVKNLPAMQETWVWSLSWEDPLEKGMAMHSSILDWRIPMDRGAWQATVYWVAKSRTRLSD